jgi:hypothetical protein
MSESSKRFDEPEWLKELYEESDCDDLIAAYGADWANSSHEELPARRARKPRRPNLKAVMKQAEAAHLPVRSVTVTRDGVTLQFGEPEADKLNDLDGWLAKRGSDARPS